MPKTSTMKVCPHCAEELPDDAAVCSNCHKNPAEVPAWATTGRADESHASSSEDGLAPEDDASIPDSVPAQYRRLEPAAARRLGIPSKVTASLVIAFAWDYVAILIDRTFLLVTSPGSAVPVSLIVLMAGYTVGLILANMGRAEVDSSDRVGQILAWAAIGLNAISLVSSVLTAPYLLAGVR